MYGFSLGTFLDIMNGVFNILLASVYITSTYKPHELAKPFLSDGHWYPILLLISHIFFLLEYIVRIYVAEDVRKYLFTMESIVNIVTILPFFVIIYTVNDRESRWRFFVRTLDLIRLHLLIRITQYIENEVTRELIKIMFSGIFDLF